VQQLLVNLLRNAHEAMTGGKRKPNARRSAAIVKMDAKRRVSACDSFAIGCQKTRIWSLSGRTQAVVSR
jgi:hypothetical protein